MSSDEFRYEVDLRLGELWTFQAFMLLVRLRLWPLLALYLVALVYMSFQLVAGTVAVQEAIKPAAFVLGIPLLLLVVIFVATKRYYEGVWKPQLPISYVINESGIATSAPNSSSQIRWEGIEELKMWRGLLLLFINRQCALIIPRRCVSKDFDRLVAYVGHRLERTA